VGWLLVYLGTRKVEGLEEFIGPDIAPLARQINILHGFTRSRSDLKEDIAGCESLEEVICLTQPQDPFYPDLLYAHSAITIEKLSKQNPSGEVVGLSKTPAEQYIEDVRDSTLNKVPERKREGARRMGEDLDRSHV
jgi:hypothetical protein